MKRALAAFVVAALLPLAFAQGGEAVHFMILAAAYTVMALGLNVVVGFAGLLDLGYVAFFAIGAHVAAHLSSTFWAPGIHLDFLLVLVAAVVVTGLAGVVIGVPTLRLRGDYVGMVTLAFGEIVGQIVSNGREIRFLGGSLTGGPNGIAGIDRIDLPFLAPFGRLDLRPWYWFALTLVALVLIANVHLRDSRVGRAWRALRDDEDAAAAAGVPIARTKLLAYGVGAALGGIAGAFLASYLSFVNPGQFTFSFSIFILAMVVLGGLGSIEGVVAGAVALTLFNHYVLPRLLTDFSEVASGIYGLLLVLVILVRPQGLHPIGLKASRLT
ncbi:branched-chain amino acid ABC transporter permease [Solirubrobacter phytolaccae]|uniref:Branched-chain amino acid ABC transporter permease n=1 Tax=Solirubrobacter phytolaccae TaxID=1404360 RepID=A0A9X3NES1_9ACTN|nr:branched-chain amino acid ABC transporter permease [Solirubrobacter phytolaccae]MDA0185273.1 branched-chain amino acid ABC transporter permease [Solirubrobacter phytolaccae]